MVSAIASRKTISVPAHLVVSFLFCSCTTVPESWGNSASGVPKNCNHENSVIPVEHTLSTAAAIVSSSYANGAIRSIGLARDEDNDGVWISYYANGDIFGIFSYRHGILSGLSILFGMDGLPTNGPKYGLICDGFTINSGPIGESWQEIFGENTLADGMMPFCPDVFDCWSGSGWYAEGRRVAPLPFEFITMAISLGGKK